MKTKIIPSIMKGFLMGIGIGLGVLATTVIAITISSTFETGDTLTATSLNELKSALEGLPNWGKGSSGNDATFTEGKVGIGTNSPRTALDINGSMAFTTLKVLPINSETFTADVSGSNIFQVDVTGDVEIQNITGGKKGQEVVIIVNYTNMGIPTFIDGDGNLKLDGDANTESDSCGSSLKTIRLIFDGTYWIETGRTLTNLSLIC